MKKNSEKTAVILLVSISVLIYLLQILLFHDEKNTFFYMLQDWAFLPIQVALVTVIAGRIINDREKENRLEKTRMLASSFFSELGTALLIKLVEKTENREELGSLLKITDRWKPEDFKKAAEAVRRKPPKLLCGAEDFLALKKILLEGRMSMLVVSSNPVLLEHEDFTDMLWAVFHLTDELTFRHNLQNVSGPDLSHLNADAERVLTEILINWLCHLEQMKGEYPYFYQLEAHRNPFR